MKENGFCHATAVSCRFGVADLLIVFDLFVCVLFAFNFVSTPRRFYKYFVIGKLKQLNANKRNTFIIRVLIIKMVHYDIIQNNNTKVSELTRKWKRIEFIRNFQFKLIFIFPKRFSHIFYTAKHLKQIIDTPQSQYKPPIRTSSENDERLSTAALNSEQSSRIKTDRHAPNAAFRASARSVEWATLKVLLPEERARLIFMVGLEVLL